MAQPGTAPAAAVHPINIHWTQAKGWWITPPSQTIPLNETARFNTDKNCTVCFSPTTTVFKASLNVNVGTPVDIPVGPDDFTVKLYATDQGSTCDPSKLGIEAMGVIIVGSGLPGGR
jgi:hypothetical protein